jgi:ligand-binding sensor domain-containing protein
MKEATMKRIIYYIAIICASAFIALALAACPTQASYQPTITPIYAATNAGLWVYNGSSWAQFTTSSGLASDTVNSVVVSGSGSGADVFVGTASGISHTNTSAASWTNWAGGSGGLGTSPVNRLFFGSNIYAATTGGLSVLNNLSSWTNDSGPGSSNDVFCYGSFIFVGTNTGLYVYNGPGYTRYTTTSIPALPNNAVTAVIGYSASVIYVGTTTGLYTFNGSAFSAVAGITASIHELFVDTYGYLYAATAGGLYVYGLSAPLFSDTAALCAWVDGAGTIYAGTSAGLRISTNSGASWTTELAGQTVNAVQTTAPLYSF